MLLIDYPKLMEEWDFNKNIINPSTITHRSGKKVWWICSKGHSYLSSVAHKTNGRNCPYCAGKKVLKGYNDLASKFPELRKEWDFNKNILKPDEVTSKSGKKVWWKCSKGHSWQAIIKNRTCKKHKCPYCAGKMATKDNNLLIKFPKIANEWDFSKNILRPDEVTSKSGKKVWWICANGHSWQAIIDSRTNKNYGCPICNLQYQTSFGEQCIYYYLKQYNALNRYKYQKKEIDIYLPDKNIGIEFNGLYWHKNKEKQDRKKAQFFVNNGINMFYIYESHKNSIKDNKIYFNSKRQYNNNLEWSIKELFKLLNITINVNIKRDQENIYKQYRLYKNKIKDYKNNDL